MIISKHLLTEKLHNLVMQPHDVIVVWNIVSQADFKILINEAFGFYYSITDLRKDLNNNFEKLEDTVMLEIQPEEYYYWTGWFQR